MAQLWTTQNMLNNITPINEIFQIKFSSMFYYLCIFGTADQQGGFMPEEQRRSSMIVLMDHDLRNLGKYRNLATVQKPTKCFPV